MTATLEPISGETNESRSSQLQTLLLTAFLYTDYTSITENIDFTYRLHHYS